MRVVHCSRCRSFLSKDELRYIVGVHVTLDIDGFGTEAEAAEQLSERIVRSQAGDIGVPDLLIREMAFTLCAPCRDVFVANPLGPTGRDKRPDLGLLQ